MRSRHTVSIKDEAQQKHISVIILASNPGYRMKSHGPKCLLEVDGKTILSHQIKAIEQKFPKAEIILVVGFFAERVIKQVPQDIRIIENQLYDNTNEMEQVRLALNNMVTNSALIVNGNTFFDFNTLKNIIPTKSCIVAQDQKSNENIGITVVNGKATIMGYGLEKEWCNIVYLESKELVKLKASCNKKNCNKMYLFEGLNLILEKKHINVVYPDVTNIFKIQTSKGIKN